MDESCIGTSRWRLQSKERGEEETLALSQSAGFRTYTCYLECIMAFTLTKVRYSTPNAQKVECEMLDSSHPQW